MMLVNLLSIFLLLILYPYENAYTFFIVHVVILIYLDITWIATGLINPGIIPPSTTDDYPCVHCVDAQKGKETHALVEHNHCMECETCIEDRDHHCHITGGCVGSGNRIAYYFFLLGMFLWVVDLISTAPYAYYLV